MKKIIYKITKKYQIITMKCKLVEIKKKQIKHTNNKKMQKNNQIISMEAKLEDFKEEPNQTYRKQKRLKNDQIAVK